MAATAEPHRPDLSAFLRSRRERLHPVDVGLPAGGRRRTPGLRREEVAQLAGVGLSWYTWLEQGRNIQVSVAFLENLARALRLNPAERAHLFVLAQHRPPPLLETAPGSVSPALQRVLDVHPYPALAWTLRWDVVGWNRAAVLLYGDFAQRSPERRNSLWSTFTDPAARQRVLQWELHARRMTARFRLDFGHAGGSEDFITLVSDLERVSPEFRRWWRDQEVFGAVEGSKSIRHPDVGVIEFEHVALTMDEPDGRLLRVHLYSPSPGESTARAERLFGIV
jgi:transcriptional regulator with XRE-family HTH domain